MTDQGQLDPRFTRGLGLFGIGLAVVSAVGWFIAPIHVSSVDGGELGLHYEENRTLLLLYGPAAALGNALHGVFFVGLRSLVAPGWREQMLARLGLLCLLAEVAIVLIGFTIFPVLAFSEASTDAARVPTDLAWFLINQAAGPVTTIGLIAMTVALWRSQLVRRWVVGYAVLVGVAHLVVACTVASSGAFTPAGPVAFTVPLVFFSWFVVIGRELCAVSGSPHSRAQRCAFRPKRYF
jgi:hypothetical protein